MLSCERQKMKPLSLSQKQSTDQMLCLKPYAGASKGRFSQNQLELYSVVSWDPSAQYLEEKIPLGESMHAIEISKAGSSFTGRFALYENSDKQPKLLGTIADFSELRYDTPSLRLLPGTKWIESRECVMAGTGVATYWSRYWNITDDGIEERLALPIMGKQKMSTSEPCRTFTLEPITSRFSDGEIAFNFNAHCELFYSFEGMTDSSSITLPEIQRTIYFSKNSNGRMDLDEKKSQMTLRDFQILTDTQLTFDDEFWEIYADDIEQMAKGADLESIRAWIDSNRDDIRAIPEKLKIALQQL